MQIFSDSSSFKSILSASRLGNVSQENLKIVSKPVILRYWRFKFDRIMVPEGRVGATLYQNVTWEHLAMSSHINIQALRYSTETMAPGSKDVAKIVI